MTPGQRATSSRRLPVRVSLFAVQLNRFHLLLPSLQHSRGSLQRNPRFKGNHLFSVFALCLQNNGYHNQHLYNGYQPLVNQQPMMMPNMPMHPHFFNNLNLPQQKQQFHQFGLPNHINQLLPNLLWNLLGHSLPLLVHPTFFQPPPLDPSAFTSQPQFNSLPYPPVPPPHHTHQIHPPGFSEPRPQVTLVVSSL